MRRLGLVLPFALAAAAAACGDNSKECGEGTTDKDGVCTPDGTGSICGDGTTLDTSSGACVPDPSLCGSGTVLINGICQDPTAGLAIDLEEGPEPNGLDTGDSPAGLINLKPIGDTNGFVVHGCVKPTEDFADLDDYLVTVQGPTLIDITADGVQGLAAGFVSLTADPSLPSWQRFGLNLANDMSHRQIYLPKAGSYDLVLSDTRSLLGLVDGATDYLEPAGNPDGTSCYYVTLKQLAVPAPTAITTTGGAQGTFDNGGLHFYSVMMPNGIIAAQETTTSLHAGTAFAVNVSGSLLTLDNGGSAVFGGIKATDTTMIVADFVYDYGIAPADFSLTFPLATTATALPTDGTAANATTVGTTPTFDAVNLFYLDAPAAGATFGMKLDSSIKLQGGIISSANVGAGTFGGFSTTVATFQTYNGLWRAPAAGRYYLAVFAPVSTAGTAYTLTSTLTALTPAAITVGTPLTAQATNTFNSVPYTLSLTGQVWDGFNATGTNTGNLAVTVYDSATAVGRLDAVTTTAANGTTTTVQPPNPTPLIPGTGCPASRPGCSFNFPATGGTKGFIVNTLPVTSTFVKVNPVTPTGTPTFGLDIAPRTYTDLMAITAPHTTTRAADTVVAGDHHRYYFTTAPGNLITITVHPTTASDVVIRDLNPAEGAVATADDGSTGDETFTFPQSAAGYTAFDVYDFNNTLMTYDLTVVVSTPYYSKHTGATVYADACAGGTTITLNATGSFPGNDEGLSAPITAPAGFTFYGAATTQFLVGSNGYLTTNTALTSSLFPNTIPDGVGNFNIGAYWDDLENVVVCTKTVGGKFVVQWTGDEYNTGATVALQTILDPADDSIEFVYGAAQQGDGTDGAIAGVQSELGDQATVVGDSTAFVTANSAVKLTHP